MRTRLILSVLMACAWGQAIAQDRVAGIAGNRTAIKAYADADGKTPDTEVKVAGLKFPLRVLERSAANYLRVRVEYDDPAETRTVWIDSAQVKLNASHEASCLHRDKSASTVATAATRGANSNCK